MDFNRGRKRERDKQRKKAKFPQPSYSDFGTPHYVDSKGREYVIAKGRGSTFEEGEETLHVKKLTNPDMYNSQFHGDSVMWVKIPKNLEKDVLFPDAQDREELRLINVANNVEATAVVDSCFYGRQRKTGYATLSNFKTLGQARPEEWKHIINKQK